MEIKEWLGHSSIEVTERRYVDFMPDNLQSAVHGPKRKDRRKTKIDDTSNQ
jgi:integrase